MIDGWQGRLCLHLDLAGFLAFLDKRDDGYDSNEEENEDDGYWNDICGFFIRRGTGGRVLLGCRFIPDCSWVQVHFQDCFLVLNRWEPDTS